MAWEQPSHRGPLFQGCLPRETILKTQGGREGGLRKREGGKEGIKRRREGRERRREGFGRESHE